MCQKHFRFESVRCLLGQIASLDHGTVKLVFLYKHMCLLGP